mgnify:CR=1 FL=1
MSKALLTLITIITVEKGIITILLCLTIITAELTVMSI